MLKRAGLLLLLATGAPGLADTAATADLIIANGRVLTMDASRSAWDAGVVVIRGDTIVAVGDSELLQAYRSDTVIDAGGDIVMPGMINLHNHLPMVAFRGLGENNFKDRLFNVMFPLEKALLSRELIRVAARQAALESALAGVTTVTWTSGVVSSGLLKSESATPPNTISTSSSPSRPNAHDERDDTADRWQPAVAHRLWRRWLHCGHDYRRRTPAGQRQSRWCQLSADRLHR